MFYYYLSSHTLSSENFSWSIFLKLCYSHWDLEWAYSVVFTYLHPHFSYFALLWQARETHKSEIFLYPDFYFYSTFLGKRPSRRSCGRKLVLSSLKMSTSLQPKQETQGKTFVPHCPTVYDKDYIMFLDLQFIDFFLWNLEKFGSLPALSTRSLSCFIWF